MWLQSKHFCPIDTRHALCLYNHRHENRIPQSFRAFPFRCLPYYDGGKGRGASDRFPNSSRPLPSLFDLAQHQGETCFLRFLPLPGGPKSRKHLGAAAYPGRCPATGSLSVNLVRKFVVRIHRPSATQKSRLAYGLGAALKRIAETQLKAGGLKMPLQTQRFISLGTNLLPVLRPCMQRPGWLDAIGQTQSAVAFVRHPGGSFR